MVDSTNKPTELVAKNYDAVFLVATWCPFSTELVKILNARIAKGALPETSLAFVVTDEWSKIEAAAVEEGWPRDELKATRDHYASKKTYPVILVKQEIVSTFPGDVYFYAGDADDIKDFGYPSVYVRQVDRFSVHAATALEMLGVPLDDMSAFFEDGSMIGSE